jgi:hypothetical protein
MSYVGERLEFDWPWVDLLAYPAALLASALAMSTTFGRLCLYPVALQFHELGHALFAWLSSRAALPLPFGFTFWKETPSAFAGLCMTFLLGWLFMHSVSERRPFGVVASLLLMTAFASLTLLVSHEHSRMLILLGGLASELLLPSALLIAFFFQLPDKLRWDFFRFIVLLPAAGTWLTAARMWFDITRHVRPLPLGSILGTPGDGSGDLERLMAEYHFNEASITHLYASLTGLTACVLLLAYGFFALRAVRSLGKR